MDATKLPKKASIHLNEKPAPIKQFHPKTLRDYLTDDDHNPAVVPMLIELAKNKREMKWAKYLDFFRSNMTGDMSSMTAESVIMVEKMKKEVTDKLNERILL